MARTRKVRCAAYFKEEVVESLIFCEGKFQPQLVSQKHQSRVCGIVRSIRVYDDETWVQFGSNPCRKLAKTVV